MRQRDDRDVKDKRKRLEDKEREDAETFAVANCDYFKAGTILQVVCLY
jgi:hypothetical protein